MKVKDLILILQELDENADIIETGSFQDMNASIPYVSFQIEVEPILELTKDKWYRFKWTETEIGATLKDIQLLDLLDKE